MSENNNSIQHLLKNKSLEIYDKTEKIIAGTPTSYKILTSLLAFILLLFFTLYKFDFFMSVSLAIVTLLSLSTINKVFAIAFGFIYGYYMYQLLTMREKTFGQVIKETNIIDNKGPLISSKTAVVVNQSNIPKSETTNAFSYQFWIYINGSNNFPDNDNYFNTWSNYRYDQWKNVFYRGDPIEIIDSDGNATGQKVDMNTMLQFPGVWLAPKLNNLSVVFNNGTETMERLEIENIPMNEWLCITILVEGYSVGVYINGKLENTILINQIYPTNIQEKNIYIGMDKLLNECTTDCTSGTKGGFPGFIGEMIYYPYVLTLTDIQESYNYYKKIVDDYQKKLIGSKKITVPGLIRNRDVDDFSSSVQNLPATIDNNNLSIFSYN